MFFSNTVTQFVDTKLKVKHVLKRTVVFGFSCGTEMNILLVMGGMRCWCSVKVFLFYYYTALFNKVWSECLGHCWQTVVKCPLRWPASGQNVVKGLLFPPFRGKMQNSVIMLKRI